MTADSNENAPQSRGRFRLGVALIVLSGILWFSLFAIPFLPMTVAGKASLGTAVFVGVQIAWWAGAALVGPEAVNKMKSWFKRNGDGPVE